MRREQSRNFRWILWLVAGAAIIALLFVCGIGTLILQSEYGEEIGVLIGGEPQPTLIPPPSRNENEGDNNDQGQLDQSNLQQTAVAVQATNSASLPTITLNPAAATNTPGIAPTATLVEAAVVEEVTAPPVATVTIPPSGSVTAFRVEQPFIIDGNLEGWDNIPSYASAFRVYSREDWDGTDDSDGFWRLAWDDENLYIGAVIIDDTHVQNSGYNTIFRGDSLEVQFDTSQDDDDNDELNSDDYQVALSPGNFVTTSPSAWRYRADDDGSMLDAPGHNVEVAANPTRQGYVLEAAIPWSDLTMRPTVGRIMGIALNVNDNDTIGTTLQEVMKSHVSTRQFADPTSWGMLILSD